jgi:hypothetical protein
VVAGVIRSTIVVTKETFPRIQSASAGSTSSARPVTTRAVSAPLSGRLSQDTIATGPAPATRRAARPATSRPGTVRTGEPARRLAMSVRTAASSRSSPPSLPRGYAASVTVSVTTATCGRASNSHQVPRSVPGYAAATAPGTVSSSFSAPRTISVYSPPCAVSSSARVRDRPVNAAIPQSAASGAAAVYQA